MTPQIKPALVALAENQIGKWPPLPVWNHVHCTGRNLVTVVVVLSESTSCEGHPFVYGDIHLPGLCHKSRRG